MGYGVQQPQTSGGGKNGPISSQASGVAQTGAYGPQGLVANPMGLQSFEYDPDQKAAQQPPQPMGKGGRQTNSATSGQPRMGQQNQYPNTVGQWDNTQIQPVRQQNGKGKGG